MWQQHYLPLGSLPLSALAAGAPLFVLLLLLGVLRRPSWVAALGGLATAVVMALCVYAMPLKLVASSVAMGAAFGLFPIGWVVYWALVLYRLTVETGQFAVIKDSIAGLTSDRRLQALLIAFALGGFIEGAAGFAAPVAVAAAMMTGLGFSPFFAAAICLLANTAPVAFGSIGIPVLTLAGTTGLPAHELSMWVGRLCAPVSLFIPAYLMLVMSGPRGLKGVLPAVAVCGLCYASMQYLVSSYVGPELVDIVASLTAVLGLIVLLKTWQPVDAFSQYGSTVLAGGVGVGVGPSGGSGSGSAVTLTRHSAARVLKAWSPYLLLVFFVLLWGSGVLGSVLNAATFPIEWPGLHKLILRGVPVVAAPTPYPAIFTLNLLATSGSACAMATIVSAALLAVSPGRYLRLLGSVARQMAFSMLTIASVLGLAFLMNYSGATATLGLAFAATGFLFPFFSAMLGWVGVFLTGSDTSANALFGNLQVVTATTLGFNPLLMASANSAGGVMGKMISLQSLAVAVAATGMHRSQEARLFRFTFGHSLLLACVIGLITALYAHVL